MIISCRGRVSIGRAESGVRSLESGVRSPESGGESRNILARLQEALWRFQRCLGRLQEVLKGFYWDSKRSCDDFVMIVLPEVAGDQF